MSYLFLACLYVCRMTVYSRCGIPPLDGVLQWWSRIPLIKKLFMFTSRLFTWPIPALSPVCPGGRRASSCPSKKVQAITHRLGGGISSYTPVVLHFYISLIFRAETIVCQVYNDFCCSNNVCIQLKKLFQPKTLISQDWLTLWISFLCLQMCHVACELCLKVKEMFHTWIHYFTI